MAPTACCTLMRSNQSFIARILSILITGSLTKSEEEEIEYGVPVFRLTPVHALCLWRIRWDIIYYQHTKPSHHETFFNSWTPETEIRRAKFTIPLYHSWLQLTDRSASLAPWPSMVAGPTVDRSPHHEQRLPFKMGASNATQATHRIWFYPALQTPAWTYRAIPGEEQYRALKRCTAPLSDQRTPCLTLHIMRVQH